MKRMMATVICAAMIITLLAISPTPVAAASESDTLYITGASVDYTAIAYNAGGSFPYRGYLYAHLKTAHWWYSADCIIGVAVRWHLGSWIYKIPGPGASDFEYLHCGGAPQSDSDTVSAKGGIPLPEYTQDIALRLVIRSKWMGYFPRDSDALCWTWQMNDSTLTTDSYAEYWYRKYASSWNLIEFMSYFWSY